MPPQRPPPPPLWPHQHRASRHTQTPHNIGRQTTVTSAHAHGQMSRLRACPPGTYLPTPTPYLWPTCKDKHCTSQSPPAGQVMVDPLHSCVLSQMMVFVVPAAARSDDAAAMDTMAAMDTANSDFIFFPNALLCVRLVPYTTHRALQSRFPIFRYFDTPPSPALVCPLVLPLPKKAWNAGKSPQV
jgi:hypothetical protein